MQTACQRSHSSFFITTRVPKKVRRHRRSLSGLFFAIPRPERGIEAASWDHKLPNSAPDCNGSIQQDCQSLEYCARTPLFPRGQCHAPSGRFVPKQTSLRCGSILAPQLFLIRKIMFERLSLEAVRTKPVDKENMLVVMADRRVCMTMHAQAHVYLRTRQWICKSGRRALLYAEAVQCPRPVNHRPDRKRTVAIVNPKAQPKGVLILRRLWRAIWVIIVEQGNCTLLYLRLTHG